MNEIKQHNTIFPQNKFPLFTRLPAGNFPQHTPAFHHIHSRNPAVPHSRVSPTPEVLDI